jgi:hypothetical protein
MADHSQMKLGKKLPVLDPKRRLKLARYVIELPPPPPSCDWSSGRKDWGMMLNDMLGCCTIAAIGHAVQTWTQIGKGIPDNTSDPIIELYYERWCGYNPANPLTDAGGVEPEVLDRWRQLGFDGHILKAYVDPNPGNITHIEQSIALFGGIYIGVQLPVSAQNQDIWDYQKDDGGNWGGHAVWVLGYDRAKAQLICITWGEPKVMTYDFWEHYCDESHTLFSPDWMLSGKGISPSQIDMDQLEKDLLAVTN